MHTPTKEDVLRAQALLLEHADESLREQEGHVSMVFSDGEWVSTKAGELFGQRTFHSFRAPHPIFKEHPMQLPSTYRGYNLAYVPYEVAQEAMKIIWGF